MEYTAENLERVVTLFYRSEAGQQAQAHQWLTEAQNSPQAWSFVWELLQPHRSSEVQFFAATTLHTKLLKHWNEVPTDHYEQLKKKIVENIMNYAMGPKIVLNRLCIALSAYVIHTIPNHWPNAFEELVSSFQPQNLPNIDSERVVWILLEILTVIPEEFQSTHLPNTQKTRVRTVLQDVSRDILKVIEMCLLPATTNNEQNSWSAADLTTYLNSARCACAWLQFGGVCVTDCTPLADTLIQLICKTYVQSTSTTSSDAEMSGDELELLEAATEALSAMMSHPYTHKYPSIVVATLRQVVQHLVPVCVAEQARGPAAQRDVVCLLWGLLVSVADTHSKLLVGGLAGPPSPERDLALQVLSAVLACCGAPGRYPVDETASALTFGFWYTLQDDALALDEAACARVLLLLKPYYRDLVSVLVRKAAYPPDRELQRYTADDTEMFRCYRQDVADTLMYCHSVLGTELLDLLNTKLSEALDAATTPDHWPQIESCLHAYYAIAECVEYEDVYLPRLMVVLRDIPYATLHVRVLATALDTFGAYAEWITEHPATLSSVVPFLTAGLQVPDVAPSATMALKDLAHNCQRFLAPWAPHVLQACHAALRQVRLAEQLRLMFSIGKVLSVLPPATIMDYLNVILAPYMDQLQEALDSPDTSPAHLVSRLKLVSALLCALSVAEDVEGEQPTVLVARCTMSLWRGVAVRWASNDEVIDVVCTMLKHLVTCTGSGTLTADLCELLGAAYRAHPQPGPLHVARLLAVLWGRDPVHSPLVTQLLVVLTTVTLASTSSAPSDHSDVLEAFYLCMAQVCKKQPRLLGALDVGAVFACAGACLALAEIPVLKASAAFLASFIAGCREAGLGAVVAEGGEALVGRVLLALGGAAPAPRSAVEPLADVLLQLNKRFGESLTRWLGSFLASDAPFPSARATRRHKDAFVRAVLREKANKRKLTEAVLEFTLICRGILRPDTNL